MKTLKYILFALILTSGVALRANNEPPKPTKAVAGAKIAGYATMTTVNLAFIASIGYGIWTDKKSSYTEKLVAAYFVAHLIWASKGFVSNAIDQYKEAFSSNSEE